MSSLIEKIWFEQHPAGWVLQPLLTPLSKLFGLISQNRRRQYQTGDKPVYRAPVPVIVVGNITAGGNGKTPVVIWLVEQLLANGYKPGVVSRGYGGKAPHYPFVVDSSATTAEAGDEPVLIQRRTGVPVVVAPKRSDAVKSLLEMGVDVVITDDGLQHYALARDIEVVVIDGQRRFGNEKLIPAGPLREGCERLAEVDIKICNGGEPHVGEIPMTLKPTSLVNLVTGERSEVSELEQIVAMAGIGHPPRFFNTLNTLGAEPVVCQPFADHQAFELSQLEQLAQQGQHLVMTEKDAVKCTGFAKDNWWYLPVDADMPAHDASEIINKINKVKEQYGSPSA